MRKKARSVRLGDRLLFLGKNGKRNEVEGRDCGDEAIRACPAGGCAWVVGAGLGENERRCRMEDAKEWEQKRGCPGRVEDEWNACVGGKGRPLMGQVSGLRLAWGGLVYKTGWKWGSAALVITT